MAEYVNFESVIAAIAFGIPEEPSPKIGVGAAGNDRQVLRALRYGALRRANATCLAAHRRRANLRGDRVGIHAKQPVISMRACVSNANHRLAIELLLDRPMPLLDGRCLCVRLDSLGRKNCTGRRHARTAGGRWRHSRSHRENGSQRAIAVRNSAVPGRK